jgi:TPP-dependent pyruvate/acetoin dehydrogenase alpha subunit
MVQCRLLAEKARENRNSLRAVVGQEAAIVGVSADLQNEDKIIASPRGLLARFVQGTPLKNIYTAPVECEAHLEHALGVALLGKFRQNGRVVVVFGETESSGWLEALHVAGTHQLPMIFVSWEYPAVEPRKVQRKPKAEPIALAEIPVIPVDGSDVVAVYRVATESIAHARRGNGPTLIACVPYRVEGERRAKPEDPLRRMEKYLADKGLFDGKIIKIGNVFKKKLEEALNTTNLIQLK